MRQQKQRSMKQLKTKLILAVFTIISSSVFAQKAEEPAIYHRPHWNYYCSFGGGFSSLSGLPNGIYEDGHSNFQIGGYLERSLGPRHSLLTGLELERSTYSLDADMHVLDQKAIATQNMSDDIKYTRVKHSSVNIPLHLRLYWRQNTRPQESNAYIQFGGRLGWTDGADFSYRSGGEKFKRSLSEGSRKFIWQAEFMVGFKGEFFDCLGLLNSSSLGVIYSLDPLFTSGSDVNFQPVHFSWRFMF